MWDLTHKQGLTSEWEVVMLSPLQTLSESVPELGRVKPELRLHGARLIPELWCYPMSVRNWKRLSSYITSYHR